MYVIKSGKASVYIKFKLNFEEYIASKTKKYMGVFDKILDLCNEDDSMAYLSEKRQINNKYHTKLKKYFSQHNKEIHDKYVYFKIDTLTEGKMFGIHHLVLSDDDSENQIQSKDTTLMLISEGCDCILINKERFINHAPDNADIHLKKIISAYPTDEYLKEKFARFRFYSFDMY